VLPVGIKGSAPRFDDPLRRGHGRITHKTCLRDPPEETRCEVGHLNAGLLRGRRASAAFNVVQLKRAIVLGARHPIEFPATCDGQVERFSKLRVLVP